MILNKQFLIRIMNMRDNNERIERLACTWKARKVIQIPHKANNTLETTYSFMNESNRNQFVKYISAFQLGKVI